MYRPVLITPPADTPVSLEEAKRHVNAIDFADDDVLLGSLVAAAVSHLDGWHGGLGRCLMPQTWRQDYDRFDSTLRLALLPVQAIISVTYIDFAGNEQTINASDYVLRTDESGAYVEFRSLYAFPAVGSEKGPVSISYRAGYADAESVPAAIRMAMLLLIGHWYANREAVVIGNTVAALPIAVDALLGPYRRIRF